ncbi:MAG: aconitase X catalytic domain-containing protein [Candidatus Diapherotrites archaeon]
MQLTKSEQEMLEGKQGNSVKKAMEILVALGEIYGAKKLIDVSSVQIAGVSYDNLGDAGLEFLAEMAKDGKVKVLTTLNPAGMDLENWQALGISPEFAAKQKKVIEAFAKMKVLTTCTCTPYFIGNSPKKGSHIAWSESSAVCYANSVLGARTNREGGPSALAAALTGKTPEYGFHLDEKRQPVVAVEVNAELKGMTDFGALGYVIGKKIGNKVALIKGVKKAGVDELKGLCASIATYGGTALFHMQGITPEKVKEPAEKIVVWQEEIDNAVKGMTDVSEVDFVAIGCPHCSMEELEQIAKLLKGKKVKRETWIAVARPIKEKAEKRGWVKTIEESGAKFAADTCFVVAPIKGRFKCMATNSAKGVFYARSKNQFKTVFAPLEKLIEIAVS